MTTLSDGVTTINLNPSLRWTDEHLWNPVEQTVERSITGALLVQTAQRTLGRPITLQADADNAGWLPYSTVQQIQAWAAIAGQQMTLTYRGVAYTVAFRHQDGAVEARPVLPYDDVQADDYFRAILRFMVTA